ncbi:alanine racemase [Chitinibacteraceae bacterium HSL-7]
MRPIRALIDHAALAHNYARAKALALGARAFAVVKADAYGHGLMQVNAALPQVDGFATLEFESALALRDAGRTEPLLLLEGAFSIAEVCEAARRDIWIAVHDDASLARIEQAALPAPLGVFVKFNTGMNRLGFAPARAAEVLARLSACAGVTVRAVMAHFATADDEVRGISWQMARFDAEPALAGLPQSLANSAALIDFPAVHRDWVRPGIMLYGATPFAHRSAASLGLRAAMTLESELIAVQSLRAGEVVGYGATFTAEHDMRIGVVACGYADGYPRHAPNGTPVVVDGVVTRLVGRVSMDMLTVDLTDVPAAGVGSAVQLWGAQLPVDVVASAAGTIGYELLTAVTMRVPRIAL